MTRSKILLLLLPAILQMFLNISMSHAKVINANSCNSSDVQQAVNSAVHLDTILIPAGNCTWTNQVVVDGSSRSLKIQGAGTALTNITLNYNGDGALILSSGVDRFLEVSGIHFIGYESGSSHYVGIRVWAPFNANNVFRVHDILWDQIPTSVGYAWGVGGGGSGLFDHITCRSAPGGSPGGFEGTNVDNYKHIQNVWKNDSIVPGTHKAVFIEDSTFENDSPLAYRPLTDGQYGVQFVVRHNSIKNLGIGGHGADSSYVGNLLTEVYNNTITYNAPSTNVSHWAKIRAGQFLLFGNTIMMQAGSFQGNPANPSIKLEVYRSAGHAGSFGRYRYTCDSTNPQLRFCSNLNKDWSWTSGSDGMQFDCKSDSDCSSRGGTCKWKLCSNSASLCTTDAECPSGETCGRYIDGASGGPPCFLAPGTGPNFNSSPAYQWDNFVTYTDSSQHAMVFSDADNLLRAGVDYFNAQKPSYTPYTYPHPLQSPGNLGKIPVPASNLLVK